MQVGVVGLGLMGLALAKALLNAGHNVSVWNRSLEKADHLKRLGVTVAASPGAIAAAAQVVLTMVADAEALAAVSLGAEGILAALPPEGVHCDMSTIAPESAEALAGDYAAHGRRFVHAPVLGSIRQIQSGTLLVFGGGDDAAIDACVPVWGAFSQRHWRFPSASQAATAKLACNLLIGQMILGLGQSLLLGQKGGVAPETLLEILSESALGCAMYASKGEKLLARDFGANFFVRHMLKDLSLVSEAAAATRTPLPLHGLTRELFVAAEQQGYGLEDYSAVVKVLEGMAGVVLGGG